MLLGFFGPVGTAGGLVLAILGAVLIVTAVLNFCPLYTLAKFDTVRFDK